MMKGPAKERQYGLRPNPRKGYCEAVIYTDKGAFYAKGPTIPKGEWAHVAMTYNGQNLRAFVNSVGGRPCKVPHARINTSKHPLAIGKLDACDREYFTGLIREVRIYSRALTPEEIVQLYQMGKPEKRMPKALLLTASELTINEKEKTFTLRNEDACLHGKIAFPASVTFRVFAASEYHKEKVHECRYAIPVRSFIDDRAMRGRSPFNHKVLEIIPSLKGRAFRMVTVLKIGKHPLGHVTAEVRRKGDVIEVYLPEKNVAVGF